ncbi:hypothetical protein ACFQMA_21130 [Halosimplex aquaticum]|uniref:Uncharacterized protein n=1 Tax=Halosimplex aquaticum TaxID=3026162 RepID=A0ABD5YAE1_9EURY|nr:hypothetical protein [Halosimplex aquaticum]
MTAPVDRDRSGVVSVRTALVVALGFAALVAVGLDGAWPAALGVAGAPAVGWGSAAVASERKRRVAAGSVALTLGSVVLIAGIALAARAEAAAYSVVLVGAAVVAVASQDGFANDVVSELYRTVSESGFVAVVGCIAFALAAFLFGTGLVAILLRELFALSTHSPMVALWWLQVGVVCVGLLAERAARVVDRWTPGEAAMGDGLAAQFRLRLTDVPLWYVAALIGQFVLATVAPNALDPFLTARPAVARATDAVLLSGVTQVALAGVAAVLAAVALLSPLQRGVVLWTGTSPGNTLSFAAGGLVAVAGAFGVGLLTAYGVAFDWLAVWGSTGSPGAAFGPALQALAGGVFVSLLATAALILGVNVLVDTANLTGGGFAVGASALFAGTVLLADGLPAVAVIGGAAVALLVWDLGVHAVGLRRDLGGISPPTRTEVVHATAAAGALLGGVVVATAVGYLAVPLRIPDDRAIVALALVLCSFVTLAFAVRR